MMLSVLEKKFKAELIEFCYFQVYMDLKEKARNKRKMKPDIFLENVFYLKIYIFFFYMHTDMLKSFRIESAIY